MNPDQTHSRKTDMDIEWTKLKTYKNKKQHFIPHLRYRCENIFKERHGINPWIYQSKRRQQFKILNCWRLLFYLFYQIKNYESVRIFCAI